MILTTVHSILCTYYLPGSAWCWNHSREQSVWGVGGEQGLDGHWEVRSSRCASLFSGGLWARNSNDKSSCHYSLEYTSTFFPISCCLFQVWFKILFIQISLCRCGWHCWAHWGNFFSFFLIFLPSPAIPPSFLSFFLPRFPPSLTSSFFSHISLLLTASSVCLALCCVLRILIKSLHSHGTHSLMGEAWRKTDHPIMYDTWSDWVT